MSKIQSYQLPKPVRITRICFISFGIVLLAAVFFLVRLHRSATYSVSATTESVSVVVADERGINARLPAVTLLRQGAEPKSYCCSLHLVAPKNTNLRFARQQNGDLRIQIGADPAILALVRLENPDGTVEQLLNDDVLRVALNRPPEGGIGAPIPDTVLLAFHGILHLGDEVGPVVERTLISGEVRIVERDPLFNERYVVRNATLDPGDEVVWDPELPGVPVFAAGFIQVGENRAIQVYANAAAESISVVRFGAPTYKIRPSLFDRIAHDPALAWVVTLLAAVAGLATLLDILYRVLESFKGWHKL